MNLKNWQTIGAIFTLVLGPLLHFMYEWTGQNTLIGIISPVNESVFEHLKLLFIPLLFFGIIEYFKYGYKQSNFIPVKVISLLLGMATIVTCFYTYVGIIGNNFLWADISTFILGVIVSYVLSYYLLRTHYFTSDIVIMLGWIGLYLLVFIFVLFTFNPPNIGLFEEYEWSHSIYFRLNLAFFIEFIKNPPLNRLVS